jgi:hypothetical protein
MSDPNLSSFIWSVADLLRGDYKQSEYGKVILPFTVLRRLDCVLEKTKAAVLTELATREKAGLNPEPFLLRKSGQLFFNTSPLDMKKLMGDQDHIKENLYAYMQAFSASVRDIFESFDFHTQIDRLAKSKLLYLVTEKFANIDLHPEVVSNAQMGAVFEELIRKFAELSNETAGEHFTPRDAIRLMVDLIFIEDAAALSKPGVVRSIYDPTAGTGGMFYNTGISTYVWIVSNRKPAHRKGTLQLIDAGGFWQKMRKSLGSKRKELSPEHIDEITRLFGECQEVRKDGVPISRVFKNEDFGYHTITVGRPATSSRRPARSRIRRSAAMTKGSSREPYRSPEFRDRRGKPDAHEESREGLREMLEERRIQPPPGAEVCAMFDQVVVSQAVDFPEINHECLPVVLRDRRRGKQVQSLDPAFQDLVPASLAGEAGIDRLELGEGEDGTGGHETGFPLLQVATLCQDDQVVLDRRPFPRPVFGRETGPGYRHEASGQEIALAQR